MSRILTWRPLRVLTAASIIIIVFGLIAKLGFDFQSARERGRLVISVLIEQDQLMRRAAQVAFSNFPPSQSAQGEDPFQRWLVLHLLSDVSAQELNQTLEMLTTQFPSMPRWKRSLERWSQSEVVSAPLALSGEVILEEGRRRHFEADGYFQIGRWGDATPLYLWSNYLLKAFIAQHPNHLAVPEALFLVGDIQMRLSPFFPKSLRSDRILNLCRELYPESIWSIRANVRWRDGGRGEARSPEV